MVPRNRLHSVRWKAYPLLFAPLASTSSPRTPHWPAAGGSSPHSLVGYSPHCMLQPNAVSVNQHCIGPFHVRSEQVRSPHWQADISSKPKREALFLWGRQIQYWLQIRRCSSSPWNCMPTKRTLAHLIVTKTRSAKRLCTWNSTLTTS